MILSGNLYDFYFRVYNKLKQSLNVPFKISDETRIDDTPMHEAIREALANCLINTDYYGSRGVVITLHPNRITFANPGFHVQMGNDHECIQAVSSQRNEKAGKGWNHSIHGQDH